MTAQSSFEREVFEEFAKVAPIDVVAGSIESRLPPQPDIYCEIEKEGGVGFELTELIDQGHMARRNTMADTKAHLSQFWKSELTETDCSLFGRKYQDALIKVFYKDGLPLQKRAAISGALFDELLRLPDAASGPQLVGSARLIPNIQRVLIHRGAAVGPRLDTSSFGWLGDPTYKIITKKFTKRYECTYPIELLVHIEIDLLPPDGAWTAELQRALPLLSGSPFRRVWVFDRTEGKIKYVTT